MPTREQLLEAGRRRRVEPYEVPELGGTLYIAVMGGTERDQYNERVCVELDASKAANRPMQAHKIHALIVWLTLSDENGVRLFGDADLQVIEQWQHPILERIHDKATAVNALNKSEQDAIEKN